MVDIENLTSAAALTRAKAAHQWQDIASKLDISPFDHVVIGAGRRVSHRYRTVIEGANVRWVIGSDTPNGADAALLNAISLYHVARRFDALVIASGDGAFSTLAARARMMNIRVEVVAEPTMLSQELRKNADHFTRVRVLAPAAARGLEAMQTVKATTGCGDTRAV